MKDLKETVTGIEYKLRVLIKKYNTLKLESQALLEEKERLLNIISEKDTEIRQLQQKQQVISIANSLEERKGSEDARLKIDELVREIDKCIQILNN